MTTDDKNDHEMLSTQPVESHTNDESPSLNSLEGASFRLSLAPERAEIRTPEKNEEKERVRPRLNHQKELLKLLSSFSTRHHHWQVFCDFCEMAAISFSNAVDFRQSEKREERYMQIVKGYSKEEVMKFPEGLGHLTMALEEGFSDVLGRTYHDLELHNKWAGQYFSPYPLCQMMARMAASAYTLAGCVTRSAWIGRAGGRMVCGRR